MILDIEDFHNLVGKVLMYCQCIEHDIKHIYAFMADGGVSDNLLKIEEERWTLGQTVNELKQYDQTWDAPLFTEKDYELLFKIVHIRNYYAHTVYLTFCYLDDEKEFDYSFDKSARQLIVDEKNLSNLYASVEEVRIRYMALK